MTRSREAKIKAATLVWFCGCDEQGAYSPPEQVAKEAGAEYPSTDAKGRTIYTNTHFLTEGEAWESALANVRASLSFEARRYREAQKGLEDAQRRLAEAAARACEMERAHEERNR